MQHRESIGRSGPSSQFSVGVLEDPVTRYDFFRRRIAPVAFGVAIVLLARQSCQKQEHTTATFVLDFGSAAAEVSAVDVDVYEHGEMFSHFHRDAIAPDHIGPARFTGALPDTDGELRIDVAIPAGVRHIVRAFHADDAATVTVPLERELH
jgi:hypothetical protein